MMSFFSKESFSKIVFFTFLNIFLCCTQYPEKVAAGLENSSDTLMQVNGTYLSADSLEKLGRVARDSGRHELALNYFRSAFQKGQMNQATWDTSVISKGNSILEELIKLNKLDGFLPLADSLIEASARALGTNNAFEAQTQSLLGNYYLRKDQVREAIRIFGKSKEIRLRLFGEKGKPLALSWLDLGNAFMELQQFDSSLVFYAQAISIFQEDSVANALNIATALTNIGNAHRQKKQFEDALAVYEQALKIRRKVLGDEHSDVGAVYNNMGNVYFFQGNYDQAGVFYDKALRIKKLTLGEDHLSVSTSLHNLGNNWLLKGDYQKAKINYEASLSIKIKELGEQHSNVASTYFMMGYLFQDMGNLELAQRNHERAVQILSALYGPNHSRLATNYNNLGTVFAEKKEFAKSKSYYKKAAAIKIDHGGSLNPELVNTYMNLGNHFKDVEQFDSAVFYLQRSLDIALHHFGPQHPEVGSIRVNQAAVKLLQNLPVEALELGKQGLDIFRRIFPDRHPNIAKAHLQIGNIFERLEEVDSTFFYLSRAGTLLGYDWDKPLIFQPISDKKEMQRIFLSLIQAKLHFLNQNHNAAEIHSLESLFQVAQEFENFLQKEFVARENRSYYSNNSRKLTEKHLQFLNTYNLDPSLEKSHALMEQVKARALKEYLNANQSNFSKKVPTEILDQESQLSVDLAFWEKEEYRLLQQASTASDSILQVIQDKIFLLKAQRDTFRTRLKNHFPDYYQLRYNESKLSLHGVRDSLLGQKQAILEYFLGPEYLFLLVVLPDTQMLSLVRVDSSVDSLVGRMLPAIYEPYIAEAPVQKCREIYHQTSYALFKYLIQPLYPALQHYPEWIIIPDGILGFVPFDALLSVPYHKKNGYQYLLQNFEISYSYATSLLWEMKKRVHKPSPQKQVLAFAPSFPLESLEAGPLVSRQSSAQTVRNQLGPLLYNEAEVRVLDSLFDADLFLDKTATEDIFKQKAGEYQVIHLSTHGKANDQAGDYSFLAFSFQDDSLENEKLYNRELYNLTLHADMVVLSACETGVGQYLNGEGIISLARGFAFAGSKSIITTLWNVNDQSTRYIMEYFYAYLKKGFPKQRALRQAKLDYLEMHPNLGVEPFYWAAIIPIGDMTPLEWVSPGHPWLWALLLAIFLGALYAISKYRA